MTAAKDHPERKTIRLPHYDYSAAGGYFVTINAYQRELLFGDVVDGVMLLNELGQIVREVWKAIPQHFEDVVVDEFVVMPNHFHGIEFIYDQGPVVRATHASPLPKARGPKKRSLGSIVGSFKSAASKQINQHRNSPGHPVWQRSFYDRVIRNDRQLNATREYIRGNPMNWLEDENHPDQAK